MRSADVALTPDLLRHLIIWATYCRVASAEQPRLRRVCAREDGAITLGVSGWGDCVLPGQRHVCGMTHVSCGTIYCIYIYIGYYANVYRTIIINMLITSFLPNNLAIR